MIKVGSKVKLKGRPTRGISFTVISIDKYGDATIKHSLSGLYYIEKTYDLALMK